MKQITALILTLVMILSLCACGVEPAGEKEPKFTQPEAVTLPDGSVVYSKDPYVEYPQTGEYKETALMTNVPGQKIPLLLNMRSDGSIDYIFADVEEAKDFQSFEACGAAYYTIAPDGSATKQDAKWMADLDAYLAQTLAATGDPYGRWRFLFAAENGVLLILAQYHNVRQYPRSDGNIEGEGTFLHSAMFKVENEALTIIPMEWTVKPTGRTINLYDKYISSIELKDGQIILSKRADIYDSLDDCCQATFNMDGTVVEATALKFQYDNPTPFVGCMDATGLIVTSMDPPLEANVPEWTIYYDIYKSNQEWNQIPDLPEVYISTYTFLDPETIRYTEDDSLYYIGKRLPSMKMIAYGDGNNFCCWFDEAGLGVLLRYTYAPEEAIEPEVVTVWSLEPIDLVQTAVAQWNHTHTSPIFRYETAQSQMEGTHLTEEDVLTRLKLELLNNQGPDVLILDGMDVDAMLDFMAPLDRVNTEGIYQNLVDAFTVDGDLLAISARMTPYLLGRLVEGTEEVTSLTKFADIVTAVTDPLGIGVSTPDIIKENGPYYVSNSVDLFQLWYPAWAETIWEGGKLNKDAYIEFVTQLDRLVEHYDLGSLSFRTEIVDTYSFEENDKDGRLDFAQYVRDTDGNMRPGHTRTYTKHQLSYTITATNHVGLYTYWKYASEAGANKKAIPHYISAIPGPDGTGVMVPAVIAGVRAGGNEEAGQEFVQLLLSRELQLGGGYHSPTLADGHPVVQKYTEELIRKTENYMHQDYTVENDYQEVMNRLDTVIIDETLYKMALYAANCCFREEWVDYSDNPDVDQTNFTTWDVLTPEEAAELLEELSRLYLAEKR